MRATDMGKPAIRAGIIIFISLIVATLSVLVSMANISRAKSPDLALRFIPFDAEALALSAERQLGEAPDRKAAAIARERATAAIRRDATSAVAFRVYGMSASLLGEPARGGTAIRHSDSLSRRDFPTRLWLIEDAVTKGNVDTTLGHFDVALRTSPLAPDMLFPILDNAIGDPAIATAVTKRFRIGPPWLRSFVEYVIVKGKGNVALGDIVARLPRTLPQIDQPLRLALVRNLIETGTAREGYRLYAASSGAQSRPEEGVRNPDFRAIGAWPPIDWELTDEVSMGAAIRDDGYGDNQGGIDFHAQPGIGGIVASQLLFLTPGKFLLRSISNRKVDDEQAMGVWEIHCERRDGPAVAILPMRARGENPQEFRTLFAVPPEQCSHQWLSLNLRAAQGQDELQGMVRSVRVDHSSN